MSRGQYIETAVAACLILELFDGQTDVPREEIERKVAKLYSSRYDFPETSLAKYAATNGLDLLKKQGKATNKPKTGLPKTGFWTINRAGIVCRGL